MYGQGKTRGMSAILNFEATTNQACAIYQTNQNINFVFQYFQKLYEFYAHYLMKEVKRI